MYRLFTPTEYCLYRILANNAGKIVTYREIESVFCCKKDRRNLVMYIGRLKSKLQPLGYIIQNHNRVGYLLEKPRKKDVFVLPVTEETEAYAARMECAIRGILSDHVEVGFESQVAIMGVAIGAILHQLPHPDRDHCIKVLVSNIREAPKFIQQMRMQ